MLVGKRYLERNSNDMIRITSSVVCSIFSIAKFSENLRLTKFKTVIVLL